MMYSNFNQSVSIYLSIVQNWQKLNDTFTFSNKSFTKYIYSYKNYNKIK